MAPRIRIILFIYYGMKALGAPSDPGTSLITKYSVQKNYGEGTT